MLWWTPHRELLLTKELVWMSFCCCNECNVLHTASPEGICLILKYSWGTNLNKKSESGKQIKKRRKDKMFLKGEIFSGKGTFMIHSILLIVSLQTCVSETPPGLALLNGDVVQQMLPLRVFSRGIWNSGKYASASYTFGGCWRKLLR